jgi:hypothetical protein
MQRELIRDATVVAALERVVPFFHSITKSKNFYAGSMKRGLGDGSTARVMVFL